MAARNGDRKSGKGAGKVGAGAATGSSLDGTGSQALRSKLRKELLVAARALGLAGVSKLKKDALVARVLAAMQERSVRGAELREPKPRSAAGGAPRPERPVAEKPPAPPAAARERPERPVAEKPPVPPAAALERPEVAAGTREEGPVSEPDPAATAKLSVAPGAAERERPAQIPWSYGTDRITAAAVDPDRLFVYWEVTDPAIERARAALGPGGSGAWLCLRVYDTSGLIFDGTNARSYFDHELDRTTRQWFFHVGKPTSTVFVEVGMKSTEGYFVKIARSGRIDFPRREPAPFSDPEWMTVRPWSGDVVEQHRAPAGAAGGGDGALAPRPPPFEAGSYWGARDSIAMHEVVLRHLLQWGWERVEWSEASGEGWFAMEGRVEWESPRVVSSWEAGPFSYPVQVEPPTREDWAGGGFAYRVGDVVRVVKGPWRVVIRNLGAHGEHEMLGTWEIHRSWSVAGGREVRSGPGRVTVRSGASELLAAGASERRWISGSETRLGGASERWRIGASEIAYGGASEVLLAGASQLVMRGASERRWAGASERRLGGASERAFRGASESRLGGASERSRLGASEGRLGGASEGRLGGASEQRLEGGSLPPLPYPPADPAAGRGA